ncbi:MAG: ABC transporter ATP-binding protein [Anaerolineales bacterium]|nr:ABC transporter ATP-binding protein [Anaerolineales bacterium]
MSDKPLLEVKNLKTHFFTEEGVARTVDEVSFTIAAGEVFGLVGESGCGKTVTAHSIMGIIRPPGQQVGGEIIFKGIALDRLDERQFAALRGEELAMIFQDPQVRLNPVFKIGAQIAELFEIQRGMKRSEAWPLAVELLERVGLPDPEERAHSYAHELSGGQAQRVMIALAIALEPELLIADEPTTALDATIQAQILELLERLAERRQSAMLLITHDLAVVAQRADRVAVMYAGHFLEQAGVQTLFDRPMHPYTQGLLNAMPDVRASGALVSIPGTVPEAHHWPAGCRFAPRCPARKKYKLEICEIVQPDLIEIAPDHLVRCWLYQAHPGHQPPLSTEEHTWVW